MTLRVIGENKPAAEFHIHENAKEKIGYHCRVEKFQDEKDTKKEKEEEQKRFTCKV